MGLKLIQNLMPEVWGLVIFMQWAKTETIVLVGYFLFANCLLKHCFTRNVNPFCSGFLNIFSNFLLFRILLTKNVFEHWKWAISNTISQRKPWTSQKKFRGEVFLTNFNCWGQTRKLTNLKMCSFCSKLANQKASLETITTVTKRIFKPMLRTWSALLHRTSSLSQSHFIIWTWTFCIGSYFTTIN